MILLFFAVPMAAGALLPLLPPLLRRNLGYLSAAITASLFGLALSHIPGQSFGQHSSFTFPWVPAMGVNLSFILDGFSLFFVLLITGMGTLIFLYSQRYMALNFHLLKFYSWMLIFAGAMLGLVTSSNLILLYVFWEMTTISSFFLIGLSDQDNRARRNAVQALMITTFGGLAMLAGFLLIYITLGTFELTEIWSRAAELRDSSLLAPIIVLIILGAATKSALFPFHIWLPSAMVAPTPVSAYLHSATMVKAGVFLVARFVPVFAAVSLWEITLVTLGLATLIIGGLLALRQSDLKSLLAYSTISQLGMMVALYGLSTELAVAAATIHLLSHAIFKGGLFLVAGTIEYEVGTRQLRSLGGLAAAMPVLATVAAIAALSLGGIPPLMGFLSKETLIQASLDLSGPSGWTVPLVLVLGSAVTLAYSLRFWFGVFGGRNVESVTSHPTVPGLLVLAPAVLAVATLAIGVYPGLVGGNLISPAVTSVIQHPYKASLHLWGGFNPALFLSFAAIAGGIIAFLLVNRINRFLAPLTGLRLLEQGYKSAVRFTYRTVPRLYLHLQNGDLRGYLVVIFLLTMALVTAGLVTAAAPPFSHLTSNVNLGVLDYGLALFLALGGVALLLRRRPLEIVLALGFVGILVAATYALYSAPDLAITQIVVELLMVVIFMLGLSRMLKMFNTSTSRLSLTLQLLISTAFGALVTVLLLAVIVTPQHPSISPFFLENSQALVKAKNVVNTILVDFRGFDTLGEITVLAIAALAVFAMARTVRGQG